MDSKQLTIITLSAQQYKRTDLPSNIEYCNYISTFSTLEGIYNAHIKSLEHIKTPYFMWVDSDDKVPTGISIPNKGIMYGNETRYVNGIFSHVREGKPWTQYEHLYDMTLIHKPICSTELAKKVIPILPSGDYWAEGMIFYLVAYLGGAEFNPNLMSYWDMGTGDFAKRSANALKMTAIWLFQNRKKIRKILPKIN